MCEAKREETFSKFSEFKTNFGPNFSKPTLKSTMHDMFSKYGKEMSPVGISEGMRARGIWGGKGNFHGHEYTI